MLKDPVVHFPELALNSRGLGGFRCQLGIGMGRGDGKVSEYILQTVAKPILNLLDNGRYLTAVGALVVAVLNQRHPRVR